SSLTTLLSFSSFFFSLTRPPPRSTLFPYTTLFRSCFCCRTGAPPSLQQWPVRPWHGYGYIWVSTGRPTWPARYCWASYVRWQPRSEEHTSELQSRENLVCRLLLEKKKKK